MKHWITVPTLLRCLLYMLLLGSLTMSGARGAQLPPTIRIGLRTKQAEIRLRSPVPVRLESAGGEALPLLANLTLVCTPKNGGVQVTDANNIILYTTTGSLRVLPDPAPADDRMRNPDAPALVPSISLLGPTRHYDGKADRPYRGSMEILPRDGMLTLVNVVDFEPYLWGVVSSEMSPRYPLEALKAQAVAARTYAARNLGRLAAQGFDLDDTAACQVYGGIFSEDPRTTQAVNETAGMVLTCEGKLIDAVYSSTCGGYTESAEDAWGHPAPYLVSVPDCDESHGPTFWPRPTDEAGWASFFKTTRGLYCLQPQQANPEAFRWVKLLTRKEIEALLPAAYAVGTVKDIVPVKRGASGRITTLRVDGSDRSVTIEKELPIRKAFGGLRSSAFTVDAYRDDNGVPVVFAFWGGGWGHGLGMCQVGAVGRANVGWNCEKILSHYYRSAVLEKW